MRNRYWVDTGDHVYVEDPLAEISCGRFDGDCGCLDNTAMVSFAAAIIDVTRGHKDPVGWFQDVALAERICALLNARPAPQPVRRRPRKRVLEPLSTYDGAAMR